MKKRIVIISLCTAVAVCAIGLAVTGYEIGWGPFDFLFKGWESEVEAIEERYDAAAHRGEIVFYGASNFRLWKDMETDLEPYKVQNHGFGGCTDHDLVNYADRLLYPYEPEIVFFQTGSNDYVNLSGIDEEKVEKCIEYKEYMFNVFHEKLPDARFIVMSGLLLPGRSQYTAMTREINRRLSALCAERDYMTFVDAEAMTFDGKAYREELFIEDKIHLNHEGQLLWCKNYIRPAIEELTR